MFYKLFKNTLLLLIAIAIAGFIDLALSKIGWPPFGGFVGGLLIGLSFKNREILYGAICGIFYIALSLVVAVLIGLGAKLTIKEFLSMLFSSFRAMDFLRFFSIFVFFIFSAWVGRVLKKKRQITSAQERKMGRFY